MQVEMKDRLPPGRAVRLKERPVGSEHVPEPGSNLKGELEDVGCIGLADTPDIVAVHPWHDDPVAVGGRFRHEQGDGPLGLDDRARWWSSSHDRAQNAVGCHRCIVCRGVAKTLRESRSMRSDGLRLQHKMRVNSNSTSTELLQDEGKGAREPILDVGRILVTDVGRRLKDDVRASSLQLAHETASSFEASAIVLTDKHPEPWPLLWTHRLDSSCVDRGWTEEDRATPSPGRARDRESSRDSSSL
jgi:hypothetical protein